MPCILFLRAVEKCIKQTCVSSKKQGQSAMIWMIFVFSTCACVFLEERVKGSFQPLTFTDFLPRFLVYPIDLTPPTPGMQSWRPKYEGVVTVGILEI